MSAGEQQLCVLILCGNHFLSVNAKQLEQPGFQPDPSRCESGHGCQSWLIASCSQGVISSARRSAKAEARGASPRESTISKQDVCNELFEVRRQLPMLSDGDNQFS